MIHLRIFTKDVWRELKGGTRFFFLMTWGQVINTILLLIISLVHWSISVPWRFGIRNTLILHALILVICIISRCILRMLAMIPEGESEPKRKRAF